MLFMVGGCLLQIADSGDMIIEGGSLVNMKGNVEHFI